MISISVETDETVHPLNYLVPFHPMQRIGRVDSAVSDDVKMKLFVHSSCIYISIM